VYDFIAKGGVIALPLVIASIVAVAVILERFFSTRRSKILPKNLDLQISELVRAGKIEEAISICRRDDSPLARILVSGLRRISASKGVIPRDELLEIVELTGKRELTTLQKYIGVLGTIAAIAPLLGLLGTVMGIIKTFSVIELHGIGNPQLLAGGISEALIATAAGICIAVPAVIFYRFFLSRSRALGLELEEATHAILFDFAQS
jgi:biopolymer transport protein ExbB